MLKAKTVDALSATPQLQWEVEQFLFAEADLLDAWRWDDWLTLAAPDIHYLCTLRPNRYHQDIRHAARSEMPEVAIFDETYEQLEQRTWQLGQEKHWAENPGSRTRHLISNVRLSSVDKPDEIGVQSSFLVYRTRAEREMDLFAGQRQDVLVRSDLPLGWQIRSRKIVLDMSTFLSSNLSTLL